MIRSTINGQIEEEDGPDTILYKGTLIDMFIHNEDGFPYCIECQKNIFRP